MVILWRNMTMPTTYLFLFITKGVVYMELVLFNDKVGIRVTHDNVNLDQLDRDVCKVCGNDKFFTVRLGKIKITRLEDINGMFDIKDNQVKLTVQKMINDVLPIDFCEDCLEFKLRKIVNERLNNADSFINRIFKVVVDEEWIRSSDVANKSGISRSQSLRYLKDLKVLGAIYKEKLQRDYFWSPA